MKKEELRKSITKTLEVQKSIIENSKSFSDAARRILGINTTLARIIIKEICEEQEWKSPNYYNRVVKYCLECGKPIIGGDSRKKFCNSSCAAKYKNKYERKQYIERWKNGEENGLIGKYGIASAVRHYIFEKNDDKCECCGKSYINPYTNLSVLQIHHKDGDCTNNREENLQLLCPNCHAMTDNYGARNKNATRKDNRKRY